MSAPNILVFAGSVRTGALSAKLAAVAAKELALLDAGVTLISLADYPMPIYDGDLEASRGIPENALKLARQIAAHAGVFISTPEYNHSLPPLLKNAIDWVSRPKTGAGLPLRGKAYGIGSTSDGAIGGARALIDLRKVLATALGAAVVPEQIALSNADRAFDESGALVDPVCAGQVKRLSERLVDMARRLGGAS